MTNLFCIWCGSRLESHEDHFVCEGCGVIYTDAALSRTVSEGEDTVAVETTISLECLHIEPKLLPKVPMPTRLTEPAESAQAPAEIYC